MPSAVNGSADSHPTGGDTHREPGALTAPTHPARKDVGPGFYCRDCGPPHMSDGASGGSTDDRSQSLSSHVESILAATECLQHDELAYPVRREELATRYADTLIELPNETESLGSVFDRLTDDTYETPAEAREAVLNQLTGAEAGMGEYNDERALEQLAADVSVTGAVEDVDDEELGRER